MNPLPGARSAPLSIRHAAPWGTDPAGRNELLTSAMTVEEVGHELALTESTLARRLAQHGSMKTDDAKQLIELEVDNIG